MLCYDKSEVIRVYLSKLLLCSLGGLADQPRLLLNTHTPSHTFKDKPAFSDILVLGYFAAGNP